MERFLNFFFQNGFLIMIEILATQPCHQLLHCYIIKMHGSVEVHLFVELPHVLLMHRNEDCAT